MVEGFRDYVESMSGVCARVYPIRSIFGVSYAGVRPPQAVVSMLWKDATIFLKRKQLVAAEIASARHQRKSYAHLTPEFLMEAHARTGTWAALANELEMNFADLYQVRKRLGMEMSQEKNWRRKCS
jgi:hypothetical protein